MDMDMDSFLAEHNDISRMCLKLGHNFIRIQKTIKSNNDGDEKKLDEYGKQINCTNNIEEETSELSSDDDSLQSDREFFQELNQQFQDDSFIETQKDPNEDENIQLNLEFQVEPEFQDNNGKKQQLPERDIKLDLKIVFESEVEEDHEQEFGENMQVQLGNEKKMFGKQVKYCSENQIQDVELEPKNKKRKQMKDQHCKNVEDNERSKINEGDNETRNEKERKSKEKVEVKSTKSNEELKEKIEKHLKNSKIDIDKIIHEKIDLSKVKDYQLVDEKFLNKCLVSIEQIIKSLEVRIYDICSTYFPAECKLRRNCYNEVESETYGANKEVVDDKIKNTVNGDKIFEKDKKSAFHKETKNNKDESLTKELVETQESFDLVILYTCDQNIDGKTQHNVNVLQIEYNEEIIADFIENDLQNVDHQVKELAEKSKSKAAKQTKKDLCLEFRFFRKDNTHLASSVKGTISMNQKSICELLKNTVNNEDQLKLIESSFVKKFSQKDFDVDVETLSDTVENLESEKQNEFKVSSEMSKEKTLVCPVDSSIYVNEEKQIKLDENVCAQEFFQEDSDVDIETLSIVDDSEKEMQIETEVEMFEEESALSSDNLFDEEDYCDSFSKCVEINEVIEIVEEYDVVSEHKSVAGNNFPTDVKSSESEQEKIEEDLFLQQEFGKNLSELQMKNQNKAIDSNRTINTQELVETQRKQIKEKSQSNAFELEYFKDKKLTNNRSSSQYQAHNKQQQKLLKIKKDFQKTKNKFNVAQQKSSEEKQQKLKKTKSSEMKDLPKKLKKLSLIGENIQEEIEELETYCNVLESELQSSDQNKEKVSNLMSKEKPYDIFEKLYSIHTKKLYEFSQSKEWPENCLTPSSLLDALFEDPNEIKPNVLLFTLYPEASGYSIKCIKKESSSIEHSFPYHNDSILHFVENENISPALLDIVDTFETNVFYSGCIVAEIHDLTYGPPKRIYRILLRPCFDSIVHDMNRIISSNRHLNWTLYKILLLESIFLLKYNPFLCGDSLPIAGTTVLMQHDLINCRSIYLNPVTNDITSKSLSTDLFNNHEESSALKLAQEPSSETFNLIDFIGDDKSVLWEFNFHLKSCKTNILTLIVLKNKDTKFSLLLCSSCKVKPVTVMKVEIIYSPEKLNFLIILSLDILRQIISNDIEVIQTNEFDTFVFYTLECFPTLPDDEIYEINDADISKLIDKFMTNVCNCNKFSTIDKYLENILENESDSLNLKFTVNPGTLSTDVQNADETCLNPQMDHEIKKSFHFCSTKTISKSSSKYLELTNMKLEKDIIVESPPQICETTTLAKFDMKKLLPEEDGSENTETNSNVNLFNMSYFLLNESNTNLMQEKSVSMLEIPPMPCLIYVMSSLPCHSRLVVSTTSIMSSFEKPFFL